MSRTQVSSGKLLLLFTELINDLWNSRQDLPFCYGKQRSENSWYFCNYSVTVLLIPFPTTVLFWEHFWFFSVSQAHELESVVFLVSISYVQTILKLSFNFWKNWRFPFCMCWWYFYCSFLMFAVVVLQYPDLMLPKLLVQGMTGVLQFWASYLSPRFLCLTHCVQASCKGS